MVSTVEGWIEGAWTPYLTAVRTIVLLNGDRRFETYSDTNKVLKVHDRVRTLSSDE